MSAKKLVETELFQPESVAHRETRLGLRSGAYLIRKNGIEFRTDTAIPVWTEMTVELEVLSEEKRVRCNGIVVGCNGNRHIGYNVSMLFTGLSKQDQAQLDHLAYSQPL